MLISKVSFPCAIRGEDCQEERATIRFNRFKEDRFARTKEFSFQVDVNILKYKFSSLGAPRQLITPLLTVSES